MASAAFRPTQRQLHGSPCFFLADGVWRALIEYHCDVGVKIVLHPHRFFRRQHNFSAIDRRTEPDAVLSDLAHLRQREHLEATGIRQDRTVPVHELVQTAVFADDFRARPQHEVEGITENDVSAALRDFFRRHAFHRPVSADRHERGCAHLATAQLDRTAACGTVRFAVNKFHLRVTTFCDRQSAAPASRRHN